MEFLDNYWNVADITLQAILSTLIIVTNSVVIYTLSTTHCLTSNANIIIISLAVADLLVGICRPFSFVFELQLVDSIPGCLAVYIASILLTEVSMHQLFLVSLDRYLLVTRPLRYECIVTSFRCKVFIALSWGVSTFFVALPLMGAGMKTEVGPLCVAEDLFELWYIFMLYLVNFQTPVLLITYMYYKIYMISRKHRRQIQSEFQYLSPNTKLNLKSAKILCVMCLYFLSSWIPYFLIVFINMFRGESPKIWLLDRLSISLAFSNSLGNPLLYAIWNKNVRKAVKKKLYWICCRKFI